MIVVLFFFCGIAFAGLSLFIIGAWYGAAQLFGFPTPTHDQASGLIMLMASIGVIGSAGLTAFVLIKEGP